MLVCSNVGADAIDDDDLAAEQLHQLADARGRARPADRLRGAGWGRHVSRVRPQLAHRAARRSPRPRRLPGQLPHPLARRPTRDDRARSRARRSSSCSSPTPRGCGWTSCSGAGTTAASPARAASTSPHFLATSWTPATAGRSRWRSSTTSSARRTPSAWRSTRCAPCCCSRRPPTRAAATRRRDRPPSTSAECCPPRRTSAATRSRSWRSTPSSSAPTEGLLAALGFAAAGRHRFKPVTRWRAGDGQRAGQRDRAGTRTSRRSRSSPRTRAVRATGEGAAGPDARARARARRGRSRRGRRARRDGRVLLPLRRRGRESWLRDFAPLPAQAATARRWSPGSITSRSSQPFDFFDEAALFYRAILGLELHDNRELASPDGLVRSRADARPRRQRSPRPERPAARRRRHPAGPQHIALATDDAIARRPTRCASAACRCWRSPTTTTTTSPPASSSSPSSLRRMRELGVLYDRDGHGELLHFYTAWSDRACSSRSSSGAAPTRATARSTRRSGWRRSGRCRLCRITPSSQGGEP